MCTRNKKNIFIISSLRENFLLLFIELPVIKLGLLYNMGVDMVPEPCKVFEFQRCFKFLLNGKKFLTSYESNMPFDFLMLSSQHSV